jgi:hypothetical protein
MIEVSRMKSCSRILLGLLVVFSASVSGRYASATTGHPDYFGPTVDITGIQETSSFGDPEPLFGAPTGSGDRLLFFPTTFSASAAGVGGFDATGAQLQFTISVDGPTETIQSIKLTDYGDADLSGVGTAATGTFVGMSGFVTVTETLSGPIAPVVISFASSGADFAPVFTPSDLLGLPGDSGVTLWSGTVEIDVSAFVPNATVVDVAFDNDLFASSEAGTTALIQKKVVDAPAIIIEVVPGAEHLPLAVWRPRHSLVLSNPWANGPDTRPIGERL